MFIFGIEALLLLLFLVIMVLIWPKRNAIKHKTAIAFFAGFAMALAIGTSEVEAASNAQLAATLRVAQFANRYLVDAKYWMNWNHTLYEQRKQAEADHSPDYHHVVLPFGSPVRLEIPKDCESPKGKWQNAVEVSCPGVHIVVHAYPAQK